MHIARGANQMFQVVRRPVAAFDQKRQVVFQTLRLLQALLQHVGGMLQDFDALLGAKSGIPERRRQFFQGFPVGTQLTESFVQHHGKADGDNQKKRNEHIQYQ